MADLFGRVDQLLRGGLSSDSMFMSWPELTNFGLGLLIQNVGIQYRQPIRRVFELGPGVAPVLGGVPVSGGFCDFPAAQGGAPSGIVCAARSQATYYIIGRPEGRLQLNRFVGPETIACEFFFKYGNPCNPNVVQFSGIAGCTVGDPSRKFMVWTLTGVVLDDYQAQASGQEMIMQEGVGAMVTGLKLAVQGDKHCPIS